MDDQGLTERIRAVLDDEPVAFAYLFGSSARGEARSDSDIDVAVRFEATVPEAERFDRALRLGSALEKALGRTVDLVDLAEAPLRLAGRVVQEGIVLRGRDRPDRVRYETDLFKRYVDFMHHARQLDVELLASMGREGG